MFGLFLHKFLKDNMSEVAKLDAPPLKSYENLQHEVANPVHRNGYPFSPDDKLEHIGNDYINNGETHIGRGAW